jgi:hypothetical protein
MGAGPRVLIVALALAFPLASGAARAAAEAERLKALRDLKKANRLFDAGDYPAALAQFERAYTKVPSPKSTWEGAIPGGGHPHTGQS